MRDEELDQMIRAGLLAHAVRETAVLRAGSGSLFAPSGDYLCWERKFLTDPLRAAKRAARPVWWRVARIAAVIVLVISLSFGAVITLSPTARAWMQRLVIQWYEEYSSFGFAGDEEIVPGKVDLWYPKYLPEGYDLVEEFNPLGDSVDLIYQNSEGRLLSVSYMAFGAGSFNVNNEHHTLYEVIVRGETGHLLLAESEEYASHLIWEGSECATAFLVSGVLPQEELFRIAESLKKK